MIISGAGLPVDLPKYTEGSDVKIAPVVSSLKSYTDPVQDAGRESIKRYPDFCSDRGALRQAAIWAFPDRRAGDLYTGIL